MSTTRPSGARSGEHTQMRLPSAVRWAALIVWIIAGYVVLVSDASHRAKELAIFISATVGLAAVYAGPRSSRS
jgi:hypothetical protein